MITIHSSYLQAMETTLKESNVKYKMSPKSTHYLDFEIFDEPVDNMFRLGLEFAIQCQFLNEQQEQYSIIRKHESDGMERNNPTT